jgi:phosphatidylglycerophosphatase A
MTDEQSALWEIITYVVSAMLLFIIGFTWQRRQKKQKPMALMPQKNIDKKSKAEVDHE